MTEDSRKHLAPSPRNVKSFSPAPVDQPKQGLVDRLFNTRPRLMSLAVAALGGALTYMNWHSATTEGKFGAKSAVIGPFLLVFGLGLALFFHTNISWWIWTGISLGVVAAGLNLYFLAF